MQTVKLQLFVSSPGDVAEERALTKRVIERLQGEFATRARLEPVFWEHEPLLATASFQEQIIKPSETDIVVCILWSRLGTRLPPRFTRADGSRYASGTEFEFEDAALAHQQLGKPDLLVYRKTAEPFVSLKDKDALLEKLKQKESLDNFVSRWFHDHQEGTLVAAFHSFDSVAKFEELLELHLRKLIEKQLPASSEITIPPSWQGGSPFRGLQTFEMEHAPIFFGRTRATSEVLEALRQGAAAGKPFVMVLGMSGSGKSSLVRAGVLPMLLQPGVIEGIGMWRHTIFRPSDPANDLLTGLANALLNATALPELQESGTSQQLSNLLRDTPQAVPSLIKSSLALAATTFAKKENLEQIPKTNLALVVDQLEELFTLPHITNQEREAFMNAIDALVRSGSVWVLATLRSDFYPRCAELEKLVSLKEGAGQYDLLPPSPSEIGQLIRQPALAAGLRFEEDTKSGERLEDLLRDAAVKNPQVLPLLEFTLEELYTRRENNLLTLNAYRQLGGVEGALAHRAETVFNNLSANVQAALPRVMQSLINVETDGTVSAKRALSTSFTTPESNAFVQALVDARLLTSDLTSDKEAVMSVTHEALLRHWPRLVEWTQHNQDSLRLQGRLSSATKRWLEENRSADFLWSQGKPLAEASELSREKLEPNETAFIQSSLQKGRRLRLIRRAAVVSLAVLALVAGVAAFQANRQRLLAETASRQATAEAERAEEEKERAETERQRAEEETLRAETEKQRAETEADNAKREATKADQTNDFLLDLLGHNSPEVVQGNIPSALELIDVAAQNIQGRQDDPEVRASILNILGKLYIDYGNYQKALPLLEEALTLRQNGAVKEKLETLTNLGNTQKELANYEEAERLYREALALSQSKGSSLDVADASNNVSVLLQLLGNITEAEPLAREALEGYQGLLPEGDFRIAQAMNNLAGVLQQQSKLNDAETLYREAITLQEVSLGPESPGLAEMLANLADVLADQERFDEALPLLERARAIQLEVLGETHADTLLTNNNLASLLHHLRRYEDAETLYRQTLEDTQRTLGNDHPQAAAVLNNLGTLLLDQGRYEEAKPLLEQALGIYKTKLGETSSEVANLLNNLATLYNDLGEVETAEQYYREALELDTKLFGESSIDVATLQVNLGALLSNRSDPEAETLLKRALQTYRERLGDNSTYTTWALHYLGDFYVRRSEYQQAEPLLLEALTTSRAIHPQGHSEVLRDAKSLVFLYLRQSDYQKAEFYARQVWNLSQTLYGADAPDTLVEQIVLATTLERQNKLAEALELFTDVVARQRQTAHDDLALGLVGLSRVLLKQGDYQKAEPLVREALKIRQATLPEGDWQLANAESLLGEVYVFQNNYQEAEPLLVKSYETIRDALGSEDLRTREALARVIRLYEAWNKAELARQYEQER